MDTWKSTLTTFEVRNGAERIYIKDPNKSYDRFARSFLWWIVIFSIIVNLSVGLFFALEDINIFLTIVGYALVASLIPIQINLFRQIRRTGALTGFYIVGDSFVMVLAKNKILYREEYDLDSVVTIEKFRKEGFGLDEVRAVLCKRSEKVSLWDKLSYENQFIGKRYTYMGGDCVITTLTMEYEREGLEESLDQLAERARKILAKQTGKDLQYYIPYLHCNCGYINSKIGSCERCLSKLVYSEAVIPDTSD